MSKARSTLQAFVEECTDCGICIQSDCASRGHLPLTSREIFEQVLTGNPSAAVKEFIARCALCGLCSVECPVKLDVSRAVMAASQMLLASGATKLEDYSLMLVDRDVHLFTINRDTYDIHYDDLKKERCDTIFFPGCTLNAYAPELTRAAYGWLEEHEGPVGLSDECCGLSLMHIGLAERAEHFAARLTAQFANTGATRVVTACSNCYYYLNETVQDVEIVSLYDLMDAHHFQIHGEEVLTVHDSCPDRSGQIGAALRHVLAGTHLVEMPHHGASTCCCGSGGIVSMVDPDLCTERARARLAEFEQTRADKCVTACVSCAYRLARGSTRPCVAHLLELAFAIRVDYDQVHARAEAMWEGEWGEYHRARLAGAKVI